MSPSADITPYRLLIVEDEALIAEETADRLQVSNRLDANESILAGARYINLLKDLLPEETEEPDRTWLALAAYNIGPGHFNAARTLARQLQADPNAWYEMKRVLPLLAQPKYAQQLKIGKARGGEAVILVENIRSYYDILHRNTSPLAPTPAAAEGLKKLVIEIEERRNLFADFIHPLLHGVFGIQFTLSGFKAWVANQTGRAANQGNRFMARHLEAFQA